MKEHDNYLAQNLKRYKELRQMTMKEFAGELDIPVSTLRTILREGNTTLHTAIHISRSLEVSLDMLINDRDFSDKLFILNHMQKAGAWFAGFPQEKKDNIASLMADIWKNLSK